MPGREGWLGILLDKSVKHYDLAWNRLFIDRNTHGFDKNIEIPCSGGQTNMKQKKDQAQRTKRKQLDDNVESGRRMGRK